MGHYWPSMTSSNQGARIAEGVHIAGEVLTNSPSMDCEGSYHVTSAWDSHICRCGEDNRSLWSRRDWLHLIVLGEMLWFPSLIQNVGFASHVFNHCGWTVIQPQFIWLGPYRCSRRHLNPYRQGELVVFVFLNLSQLINAPRATRHPRGLYQWCMWSCSSQKDEWLCRWWLMSYISDSPQFGGQEYADHVSVSLRGPQEGQCHFHNTLLFPFILPSNSQQVIHLIPFF